MKKTNRSAAHILAVLLIIIHTWIEVSGVNRIFFRFVV